VAEILPYLDAAQVAALCRSAGAVLIDTSEAAAYSARVHAAASASASASAAVASLCNVSINVPAGILAVAQSDGTPCAVPCPLCPLCPLCGAVPLVRCRAPCAVPRVAVPRPLVSFLSTL